MIQPCPKEAGAALLCACVDVARVRTVIVADIVEHPPKVPWLAETKFWCLLEWLRQWFAVYDGFEVGRELAAAQIRAVEALPFLRPT
jgi:hypothetical protein